MASVGESLVDALYAAGVRRIYGLVGDSLDGLTDAVRRREELEWVGVRHEEVAAFAAGAEAHLTGSLAVCAGSCGPGNLHLSNGLYDCHRSRVPVLAIAAQIPSRELGTSYFQETRPDILLKGCSHYCEPISLAQQAPRVLELALRSALGQRGEAVVTIPGDVTQARAPEAPPLRVETPQPAVRPSAAELTALAKLLNGGRRVTILAGARCAGAHEELLPRSLCKRPSCTPCAARSTSSGTTRSTWA